MGFTTQRLEDKYSQFNCGLRFAASSNNRKTNTNVQRNSAADPPQKQQMTMTFSLSSQRRI